MPKGQLQECSISTKMKFVTIKGVQRSVWEHLVPIKTKKKFFTIKGPSTCNIFHIIIFQFLHISRHSFCLLMDLSLNLLQSLGKVLRGDVLTKLFRYFRVGFYRVLLTSLPRSS